MTIKNQLFYGNNLENLRQQEKTSQQRNPISIVLNSAIKQVESIKNLFVIKQIINDNLVIK